MGLDPYTAISEPDPKRGGYVIKITEHQSVPPIFGLIAADFVNNLRALLDNLVWVVASSNAKRRRLAFPLVTTARMDFDKLTKTSFAGMRSDVVEAIERHQPYNRTEIPVNRDRLVLLHKMWNADKHHAPMGVGYWAVAATATAYGDNPLASDFTAHFGPFRKGQAVARVTSQGAEYDLHPHISLDIGFKTRRPNLAIARYTLRKMYEIVAKDVLPDFRQFLV